MPNLGAEATEGRVSSWLKNAGDTVTEGEAIAEIETDKATLDLEAPASGVLREILVPAGADAPVGAVLAIIDLAGLPMTREEALGMRSAHAIGTTPEDAAPHAREAAPHAQGWHLTDTSAWVEFDRATGSAVDLRLAGASVHHVPVRRSQGLRLPRPRSPSSRCCTSRKKSTAGTVSMTAPAMSSGQSDGSSCCSWRSPRGSV